MVVLLYLSRVIYNIVAVTVPHDVSSFGFGWINVSDEVTFCWKVQKKPGPSIMLFLRPFFYLPARVAVLFFVGLFPPFLTEEKGRCRYQFIHCPISVLFLHIRGKSNTIHLSMPAYTNTFVTENLSHLVWCWSFGRFFLPLWLFGFFGSGNPILETW